MPLLDAHHFRAIFEPLRGTSCALVTAGGNAGDLMIHRATRQLCRSFNVPLVEWPGDPSRVDHLLLFGGGNMGSGYEEGRTIRNQALAFGLPATLLPQSWMAAEEIDCERIFVRERASQELAPQRSQLAPDLALGMKVPRFRQRARKGKEWFLRIDAESVFPLHPPHDPTRYATTINDYLRLAAEHREIQADRLHFAIASLMVGSKTTLLPNSYHKNRSMWETWLKDLGCGWSDHPS